MFMLNNAPRYRENGFTLTELMIVVVVVGILATIALPAYQDSVRKAKRSDAQGALMGFANAMERHFTTNGTYLGAGTTNGGDEGAPTVFQTTSPLDSDRAAYNLTIKPGVTASAYTLVAEAIGGQEGDGDMELTSTGVRRWDQGDDGFNGTTDQNWEVD